jgi:transcriptional regulator with XRE-family HTH domain
MGGLQHVIAVAAGKELRRLRKRAGLTLRQVAAAVGSHHPIIARTEGGHHMPSLEVCARQAAVCGGSLFDVLDAVDYALGFTRPRHVSARARGSVRPAVAA